MLFNVYFQCFFLLLQDVPKNIVKNKEKEKEKEKKKEKVSTNSEFDPLFGEVKNARLQLRNNNLCYFLHNYQDITM